MTLQAAMLIWTTLFQIQVSPNGSIPVELRTGMIAYDARQIRALTASDTLTCNAGTGPWAVTDNGGSLTVDSTQLPGALDASGYLKVHEQGTAAVSGTVTANAGSGTFTVGGTVTANAGTGTFTVGQATGTNLHVVVDSAPTTTVTGTVTANAGSGTFTTSDSRLPSALDGSGYLKVHEQGTATVSGTVTANAGSGTFAVSGTVTANAGTNLNTSRLRLTQVEFARLLSISVATVSRYERGLKPITVVLKRAVNDLLRERGRR